jgi:putative FmdB family regulatory protein
MRYDYQCSVCKKVVEQIHTMKEDPQYKCPDCGAEMVKQFSPPQFIMKGGTPAIHYREKMNRLKKREKLSQQSVRTGPKLRPNVAGMEVDSWKDAQKVAKEAGLNHESYNSYVQKEEKEKKGKILV